ncbi:MAG: hypothetical protein PHC34_13085 [Candidatus Gastranaerophilales bacterium]|nr:hypothetical protein [Candidatus Gastranaerophilales bacterium]
MSFGKNVRQIVDEIPNPELKKLTKWATSPNIGQAVEDGIQGLLEYTRKGQVEKQEVTKIFKNLIESEELKQIGNRKNLFYGYEGMEDEYPGYIQAYEKLTGIRLDVTV